MKPKEYSGPVRLIPLRVLLVTLIYLAIPVLLFGGTGPSWWYNPALTTSGTVPVISGTANDYAAANQGQVKNIAVAAVTELDADLAQFGGAGGQLDQLASTLI